MISPEFIVQHIEGTPDRRATFKQLLRELKARGGDRGAVRQALEALVRQGRLRERRNVFTLVERAGGWAGSAPARPGARAAAPAQAPGAAAMPSGEVLGRLSLHRDGYGFVTPEPPLPGGGDVFIPPPAMLGAMHGDTVSVRLVAKHGPAEPGRREGRVVAIVRRAQATLVGTFHRDPRNNYVQPVDNRVRERIVIPAGDEVPAAAATPHRVLGAQVAPRSEELDGQMVEIEVTRFPSASLGGRGRVIEVLGRREDFGVDVEIMIRKHHLPHRFPEAVLAEAAALPEALPEAELAARRDFRGLPIVTIDGESARDFDDAVHVARIPGGGYQLQVHIADVAYYVAPGSAIDQEARLRGTSVYFPDRAVPMLPAELSTDLCSLRPRQDRLVMSCLMEMDREGELVGYELAPGVIHSAERMTYTQVNAVLEGEAEARERFAPLVGNFELMAELQGVLYAKRQRRGSIDFDLPEPEIAFDEFGLMRSIVKSERNVAHRLIEEFMLAAAETVARHLEKSGVASVYRIHEQPELKKVAEFEEMAGSFGYSLGLGPLPIQKVRVRGRVVDVPQPGKFRISPRNYQKLAAKIAGTPEERMLSFLMLRSLKQARYSAYNEGHFALATACYTHFTSPIRRYPDLMVHRILKAHWDKKAALPQELTTAEAMEPLCRQSSEAERRADEAERELMDWKKVRFMEQRLGEEFPALILRVTRDGFWVELAEMFIEGFVPADALTDDDYRFQSATQEWVGERRKRRYRLGARLPVTAVRIDPVRQQIHFAPAGVAVVPPSQRAERPRRPPPAPVRPSGRKPTRPRRKRE